MIAQAVQAGKPVVVFIKGEEQHLFNTVEKMNDKFQVARYKTTDDLKKEVAFMLDFVGNTQGVRFNFFVSPEQSAYMDWIARNRKISRSVYMRRLIESDMIQTPDFTE